MSLGGPECSASKAQKNYLEDVLTLNEVTVKVAGCIELKEQLRNSTPFGRFVPLRQKCLSELWLKKKKNTHFTDEERTAVDLEQHRFGLCGSTSYVNFFSKYTVGPLYTQGLHPQIQPTWDWK